MKSNFRIIPALIVVATLSFSVRLAEVVIGIRDISGAALAASDEGNAIKEMDSNADTKDAGKDDKMPMAEGERDSKVEMDMSEDLEDSSSKWRDAIEDNFSSQTIKKEVFDDLVKRRKELEVRERNIATREALLRAAEQELDRKYQEMDVMRVEIEALLDQQTEEEQKRIQSLVKIYEGMKPKQAAAIFNTLDLDVLINVVSYMSERRLSPILAAMNPERAKTVTIMLAEQKSLPEFPSPN